MYTLFYLDAVRDDILNAKQWYAEQQKGLDEKFFIDEENEQIILTGVVHQKRKDAGWRR